MKVAQNDETNPDTLSVHLSHASSMLNMEPSPSGHLSHTGPEPGKLSRMFPTFAGITSYRVRSPLAPRIAMLCFVMPCVFRIYCFFPLFSPVDYEADAAAAQFDYRVDDPSLLPEQPGKPPLDHQISPILLYTACIRVV